jgi:hypothetical protein
MCLLVSRLFWVSSLAYPNLLGTKGYVVVVVVGLVSPRPSSWPVCPLACSFTARPAYQTGPASAGASLISLCLANRWDPCLLPPIGGPASSASSPTLLSFLSWTLPEMESVPGLDFHGIWHVRHAEGPINSSPASAAFPSNPRASRYPRPRPTVAQP